MSHSFGLGTEISLPFHAMIGVDDVFLNGKVKNKEWRTEVTLTNKEKFSTSPSELFVGGGGDVFVGAGWNFLFGVVGVV